MKDELAEWHLTVENEHDKGRGLGCWWIALGLLLAAYPLSTGPAAKLVDRGLIPEAAFGAVYRPLGVLCYYCPPAVQFFRWYMENVWRAKTH